MLIAAKETAEVQTDGTLGQQVAQSCVSEREKVGERGQRIVRSDEGDPRGSPQGSKGIGGGLVLRAVVAHDTSGNRSNLLTLYLPL